MNASMKKLMVMSKLLRLLILLAATAVTFYLAYGYFINDEVYFNTNALFFSLWDNPSASQAFLLASKFPLLFSFLLSVYWLQKLLGYYQQGQFFGPDSMHCYLWLVWLKLISFILSIGDTLWVGYYARHFKNDVNIELTVDFNQITTILLMLVIIYLLKAAKEIEAENKEFI